MATGEALAVGTWKWKGEGRLVALDRAFVAKDAVVVDLVTPASRASVMGRVRKWAQATPNLAEVLGTGDWCRAAGAGRLFLIEGSITSGAVLGSIMAKTVDWGKEATSVDEVDQRLTLTGLQTLAELAECVRQELVNRYDHANWKMWEGAAERYMLATDASVKPPEPGSAQGSRRYFQNRQQVAPPAGPYCLERCLGEVCGTLAGREPTLVWTLRPQGGEAVGVQWQLEVLRRAPARQGQTDARFTVHFYPVKWAGVGAVASGLEALGTIQTALAQNRQWTCGEEILGNSTAGSSFVVNVKDGVASTTAYPPPFFPALTTGGPIAEPPERDPMAMVRKVRKAANALRNSGGLLEWDHWIRGLPFATGRWLRASYMRNKAVADLLGDLDLSNTVTSQRLRKVITAAQIIGWGLRMRGVGGGACRCCLSPGIRVGATCTGCALDSGHPLDAAEWLRHHMEVEKELADEDSPAQPGWFCVCGHEAKNGLLELMTHIAEGSSDEVRHGITPDRLSLVGGACLLVDLFLGVVIGARAFRIPTRTMEVVSSTVGEGETLVEGLLLTVDMSREGKKPLVPEGATVSVVTDSDAMVRGADAHLYQPKEVMKLRQLMKSSLYPQFAAMRGCLESRLGVKRKYQLRHVGAEHNLDLRETDQQVAVESKLNRCVDGAARAGARAGGGRLGLASDRRFSRPEPGFGAPYCVTLGGMVVGGDVGKAVAQTLSHRSTAVLARSGRAQGRVARAVLSGMVDVQATTRAETKLTSAAHHTLCRDRLGRLSSAMPEVLYTKPSRRDQEAEEDGDETDDTREKPRGDATGTANPMAEYRKVAGPSVRRCPFCQQAKDTRRHWTTECGHAMITDMRVAVHLATSEMAAFQGRSFWWGPALQPLQAPLGGAAAQALDRNDALRASGVQSVEIVDAVALSALAESGTLTSDHQRRVDRYREQSRGGVITSRPGRGRMDGRLYAQGPSLQKLPAVVRAAVCPGYYDIDFSSCYQAIVLALLRKGDGYMISDSHVEVLRNMVEQKDECRSELAKHYGCGKGGAKKLLLRIMFGGRNDEEWANEHGVDLERCRHHVKVIKYRRAMEQVAKTLARQDDMEAAKKRDKRKTIRQLRFSALSELCGRVEAQLLELMMYFFETRVRACECTRFEEDECCQRPRVSFTGETMVRIHDGFLMERAPHLPEVSQRMLDDAQRYVYTKSGIFMGITVKMGAEDVETTRMFDPDMQNEVTVRREPLTAEHSPAYEALEDGRIIGYDSTGEGQMVAAAVRWRTLRFYHTPSTTAMATNGVEGLNEQAYDFVADAARLMRPAKGNGGFTLPNALLRWMVETLGLRQQVMTSPQTMTAGIFPLPPRFDACCMPKGQVLENFDGIRTDDLSRTPPGSGPEPFPTHCLLCVREDQSGFVAAKARAVATAKAGRRVAMCVQRGDNTAEVTRDMARGLVPGVCIRRYMHIPRGMLPVGPRALQRQEGGRSRTPEYGNPWREVDWWGGVRVEGLAETYDASDARLVLEPNVGAIEVYVYSPTVVEDPTRPMLVSLAATLAGVGLAGGGGDEGFYYHTKAGTEHSLRLRDQPFGALAGGQMATLMSHLDPSRAYREIRWHGNDNHLAARGGGVVIPGHVRARAALGVQAPVTDDNAPPELSVPVSLVEALRDQGGLRPSAASRAGSMVLVALVEAWSKAEKLRAASVGDYLHHLGVHVPKGIHLAPTTGRSVPVRCDACRKITKASLFRVRNRDGNEALRTIMTVADWHVRKSRCAQGPGTYPSEVAQWIRWQIHSSGVYVCAICAAEALPGADENEDAMILERGRAMSGTSIFPRVRVAYGDPKPDINPCGPMAQQHAGAEVWVKGKGLMTVLAVGPPPIAQNDSGGRYSMGTGPLVAFLIPLLHGPLPWTCGVLTETKVWVPLAQVPGLCVLARGRTADERKRQEYPGFEQVTVQPGLRISAMFQEHGHEAYWYEGTVLGQDDQDRRKGLEVYEVLYDSSGKSEFFPFLESAFVPRDSKSETLHVWTVGSHVEQRKRKQPAHQAPTLPRLGAPKTLDLTNPGGIGRHPPPAKCRLGLTGSRDAKCGCNEPF